MKPKTKKILIIVAAVLIVGFIVWLVARKSGKGTTSSIIARLNADDNIKSMIKARVAYIESYAATADATAAWSVENLQKLAQERHITYQQELVWEAIYSLVDSGSIEATAGAALIAQIK